jgi:hypothetical protein
MNLKSLTLRLAGAAAPDLACPSPAHFPPG